jgi:hypothetical protein
MFLGVITASNPKIALLLRNVCELHASKNIAFYEYLFFVINCQCSDSYRLQKSIEIGAIRINVITNAVVLIEKKYACARAKSEEKTDRLGKQLV